MTLSVPLASTKGHLSPIHQRSLFHNAGLPIVPGTVGPVSDYAHLEGQLGLAKLLTRDENQSNLVSPVWLKAPGRRSRQISTIDELYVTYTSVHSSQSSEDIVVEQFFESAYVVNLQFPREETPPLCYMAPLRNLGYPLSPDVLSILNQGIGVLEKIIPIAKRAKSIASIDGNATVKFLIDSETSDFFILKVKEGFVFEPPSSIEEVQTEVSGSPIPPKEIQSQTRDVKKANEIPIPPYILGWLVEHRMKNSTFEKFLNRILNGPENRRQSFKDYLRAMPAECENEIKVFMESIRGDEERSMLLSFLFQILSQRISGELDYQIKKVRRSRIKASQ